jgi:hypothetical protein
MTSEDNVSTVDESLTSTTGVPSTEFDAVLEQLQPLNARLRSYPAGKVELHLFVKDLDTQQQKITLEARIVGQATLVATSHKTGLQMGVQEVRDDLIRLMTDALNKQEPRNNRAHRDTTP